MKKENRNIVYAVLSAIIILVAIFLVTWFIVTYDMFGSEVIGTWEYGYKSSIDGNTYLITIGLFGEYEGKHYCYVEYESPFYDDESITYEIKSENFYEANHSIYFDPWISLPTHKDTRTHMGQVIKKMGIMLEGERLVLIQPGSYHMYFDLKMKL